ncbi:MAG: hypothetical protein PHU68_02170 [Paludibacter sp.]|nr:hypothetical protein [Paludibacter sp.]
MITPILILFFVLVVEMVSGNGLSVNSGKISGADGDVSGVEAGAVRFDLIKNGGFGKPGAFVSGLCVSTGRFIVAPIVNLKHSVFNIPVKCMFAGFMVYSNRVLSCGSSQFAGFSFISKAFTFSTPDFVTYSIADHSFTGTLHTSSFLPGAALTGIISSTFCPREVAFAADNSRALPQFHSPFFTRT